ncbi:MAG: hypothetical protein KGM17_08220 [Sphingomonadales bacterium]|nr:hypothetical protein [Sphingomonadales bacterium]
MLILVAAALVVAWVLAFVVLHVTSALIHLLLLGAVIVAVIRLFSPGTRSDAGGRL